MSHINRFLKYSQKNDRSRESNYVIQENENDILLSEENMYPLVQPLRNFTKDQMYNSNAESLFRILLYEGNNRVKILLNDQSRSSTTVIEMPDINNHTQICSMSKGRQIEKSPKGKIKYNDLIISTCIPDYTQAARKIPNVQFKSKSDQLSSLTDTSIDQVIQKAVRAIAISHKVNKPYGQQLEGLFKLLYHNTNVISQVINEQELLSELSIKRYNATANASTPTVQGNINMKSMFTVMLPKSVSETQSPDLAINHIKHEESMYALMQMNQSMNSQVQKRKYKSFMAIKFQLFEKVQWKDVFLPEKPLTKQQTNPIKLTYDILRDWLLDNDQPIYKSLMDASYKGTIDHLFTQIKDRKLTDKSQEDITMFVTTHFNIQKSTNAKIVKKKNIRYLVNSIRDRILEVHSKIPLNVKLQQPNILTSLNATIYDNLIAFRQSRTDIKELRVSHAYNNPYISAMLNQLVSGYTTKMFPVGWIRFLTWCGIIVHTLESGKQSLIHLLYALNSLILENRHDIANQLYKCIDVSLVQYYQQKRYNVNDLLINIIESNIDANYKILISEMTSRMYDKGTTSHNIMSHVFCMLWQVFHVKAIRTKIQTIVKCTKADMAKCGKYHTRKHLSTNNHVNRSMMFQWQQAYDAKVTFYTKLNAVYTAMISNQHSHQSGEQIVRYQLNKQECIFYEGQQKQLQLLYMHCQPKLTTTHDEVLDKFKEKAMEWLDDKIEDDNLGSDFARCLALMSKHNDLNVPMTVEVDNQQVAKQQYKQLLKQFEHDKLELQTKWIDKFQAGSPDPDVAIKSGQTTLNKLVILQMKFAFDMSMKETYIQSHWSTSNKDKVKFVFTHGPLQQQCARKREPILKSYNSCILVQVGTYINMMIDDIKEMINPTPEAISNALSLMIAHDSNSLFHKTRQTDWMNPRHWATAVNQIVHNEQMALPEQEQTFQNQVANLSELDDAILKEKHSGYQIYTYWRQLAEDYTHYVLEKDRCNGQFIHGKNLTQDIQNESYVIKCDVNSLLQVTLAQSILKFTIDDMDMEDVDPEKMSYACELVIHSLDSIKSGTNSEIFNEVLKEYGKLTYDKENSRTYLLQQAMKDDKLSKLAAMDHHEKAIFCTYSTDNEIKHKMLLTANRRHVYLDDVNTDNYLVTDLSSIDGIKTQVDMSSVVCESFGIKPIVDDNGITIDKVTDIDQDYDPSNIVDDITDHMHNQEKSNFMQLTTIQPQFTILDLEHNKNIMKNITIIELASLANQDVSRFTEWLLTHDFKYLQKADEWDDLSEQHYSDDNQSENGEQINTFDDMTFINKDDMKNNNNNITDWDMDDDQVK